MGCRPLAVLIALTWCAASAETQAGRSDLWIRGQRQDLWYLPAAAAAPKHPAKILFLPGDGGWRGFAVTIAETMASWGYDVYGLDTRHYLTSFTGKTHLTEREVMNDIRAVAESIAQKEERVLLAGWSEGAGLSLLAASLPENRKNFLGLAAIGLAESSVLGWKLADNITYITKADPDEPRFPSLPYLPHVAP
jgi:type IV secretory pathway VirJ component